MVFIYLTKIAQKFPKLITSFQTRLGDKTKSIFNCYFTVSNKTESLQSITFGYVCRKKTLKANRVSVVSSRTKFSGSFRLTFCLKRPGSVERTFL